MRASFFPIAILLACFFHGLAVFIIFKLLPDIPEKKQKTIPVLIVSADQVKQSQTYTQATAPSHSKQKIQTNSQSSHSTHSSTKRNTQTQKQPQTSQAPEIPSVTGPELVQKYRSDRASKSLQNLFGQNNSKASPKRKQTSEQDLPKLSDYETSLLQRLSQGELYAEYHKVLARHQRTKIDFSVEITLFSNGAIKKAVIHHSSKIPQIDELAIRTAYNASPYKKPPTEDIEKGFRYVIPISYQK